MRENRQSRRNHARSGGERQPARLGQGESERGNAVAEFALVAPMLILMVLGLICLALTMHVRSVIIDAAVWETQDNFEILARFVGVQAEVRMVRFDKSALPPGLKLCDYIPYLKEF